MVKCRFIPNTHKKGLKHIAVIEYTKDEKSIETAWELRELLLRELHDGKLSRVDHCRIN